MDVLPRITRQVLDLFHEMSLSQRVTSMVVSCLVLFGFGWLVLENQRTDFQAVSYGKVFTTDELNSAEQALMKAGLTGFRREGRKLSAHTRDINRYNAALLESDVLPADLGAQMLKHYEKLGPFSTDRQRQQMKEAYLLQELRRMIKEVPDVEDAHVTIASSERRVGWNQKPRATANVSLKPRAGRELSSTLINSLRHVVASMVPDLKPADVTVFDVTRGQAFIGETTDDPTDSLYLQRAREFTRQYEQQIQKALSHIPHVSVTVHVDLDALKSSVIRSETVRSKRDDFQVANQPVTKDDSDSHLTGFRGFNALPTESIREVSEKQLVAAMPKAVQVCVSIPRDYLRELIDRRVGSRERLQHHLDPATLEDEELTKVERIVGRLIPADSPSDAVSVNFVERLDQESPSLTSVTPIDETSIFSSRWGGPIALGGFFLISALLMLRRKTPVADLTIKTETVSKSKAENAKATETVVDTRRETVISPDRMTELRDEVRSMVESDPAASAALVSRWLSGVHQ